MDSNGSQSVSTVTPEPPASTTPAPPPASKRPLPKAQFPLPIRMLAGAMKAISRPAGERTGGERALSGGVPPQGSMPAIVPMDPEAALGAAKVAVKVIGAIGGDNKGVALALGAVVLVGLAIFGLAKLSSRGQSAAGGQRPEREHRRGHPDAVDEYAAMISQKPLQAPQFAGGHDPEHVL